MCLYVQESKLHDICTLYGTWNMNDGHLIASSVDTRPATMSLRTTLHEKRDQSAYKRRNCFV